MVREEVKKIAENFIEFYGQFETFSTIVAEAALVLNVQEKEAFLKKLNEAHENFVKAKDLYKEVASDLRRYSRDQRIA